MHLLPWAYEEGGIPHFLAMPYIQRNDHQQISALIDEASADSEFLSSSHPEVLDFLARCDVRLDGSMNDQQPSMLKADLGMIRVIEDVIDLLVARNVILFSDLPAAVQTKLLAQKGRREQMFGHGGDLMVADSPLL